MDPNLFHLDWERTFEVLAALVVVSFLTERFLSLFFENRLLLPMFTGTGLKEIVAFAVSFGICHYTHFDAIRMILLGDTTNWPGEIVTAGIIAGGAKGSVKLFRDVLGWKSSAYQEYEGLRDQGSTPKEAAKRVSKGEAPSPIRPVRG